MGDGRTLDNDEIPLFNSLQRSIYHTKTSWNFGFKYVSFGGDVNSSINIRPVGLIQWRSFL